MTGQAKTVTATAVAIITSSENMSISFTQLWRQYRQHDIHSDLTSLPGYGATAGKHAAHHEKQHDLFGPWDRHAEEVATDNVDKIDADAGDQK